MKVSLISGGLGNQIYHYIFARFLEEYLNEPVVLDDMYFFKKSSHNGFEMKKLFKNVKLNLLSDYYNEEEWEFLKNKVYSNCIPLFLQKQYAFIGEYNSDKTILQISQTQPILSKVIQPYQFEPNIIKITAPNIYYYGYWQNDDYLNKSKGKDKVLKELEFEPIKDSSNQKYLENITRSNSVGVHIRRGDFVDLGRNSETLKYSEAVKKIKQKSNEKLNFFIFSDDIEWCKDNIKELGLTTNDEVVFIEGNTGNGNNYVDIQLLSNCKYLILTKLSSFSKISKLLNQNLIDYIEV